MKGVDRLAAFALAITSILGGALVPAGCGGKLAANRSPPSGATGNIDSGAVPPATDASEADSPGDVTGEGSSSSAALRFDGVRAYLNLAAASGAASEKAFSSEIWFRTTSLTGVLFEVYSSGMPGADRSTFLRAGQVCFYVYTPAFSEVCTTGATLNDGAWHNVAATLGAAGQFVYVDGMLQGMDPAVTTSAFNWDTGFRVGYGYIGGNGPLVFFAGDIDDVRVWSVQRTAAELAAGRGHSIDPATVGLQGYWKLDESGTAKIAPDSTAAMNDGTLLGFSFNPSPWISPGAF